MSRKRLLDDADDVLSMLRVVVRPLQKWSSDDLNTELRTACDDSGFFSWANETFSKDNVVIMVKFNWLVVAACVLVLRRGTNGAETIYDVTVVCPTGKKNLEQYLIVEAERYARQRDINFIRKTATESTSVESVRETLPDSTDMLLSLFEIKIRKESKFYKEEKLHNRRHRENMSREIETSVCRGHLNDQFTGDFVQHMLGDSSDDDDDDGGHYVANISFAGKILSIAFLVIKESFGEQSAYLDMKLLCARKYTGLGYHMVRHVEDFAVRQNLESIKVEATGGASDFYTRNGFAYTDLTRDGLICMTKRVRAHRKKTKK